MLVTCLECNIEFEKQNSEVKRSINHFCSRSCSITYNNKLHPKRTKKNQKLCVSCGEPTIRNNKYCSACISIRIYNITTDISTAKTDRTRKSILLKTRKHECEICKTSKWKDLPISLELHHIDGDSDNNIESNLQLICPNCHAQTSTYKGANININSSRQLMRRIRYSEGKTY
jgi:hypothetical protein